MGRMGPSATTPEGAIASAVFFSDVHLDPAEPARTAAFLDFLDRVPGRGGYEAAFALGDLFHFWIGPRHVERDDFRAALDGLAALVRRGVRLTFFHGTRDFHLGDEVRRRLGASDGVRILADAGVVRLAGAGGGRGGPGGPERRERSVYLAHGDLLCERDTPYLAMRRAIRSRAARRLFLALPLGVAFGLAGGFRRASVRAIAAKAPRTLALSRRALRRALARTGADLAVVGHVHRASRLEVEIAVPATGGTAATGPVGDGAATAPSRRGRAYTLGAWDHGNESYLTVRDGRVRLHDGPGGSRVLFDEEL